MKKIFLLFFFVPLILCAQKQDWHPFPENQISFFNSENGKSLQVIKIDSVSEKPDFSIYFNQRTPYRVELTEDYILYDPYTSWIGTSTLVDDDKAVFQNYMGESMPVFLNKDLEENWLFYTFNSGDYINAWVESAIEMEILENVTDDIQVIRFQAYDNAGSPLEHDINTDSLIISKNYGIVRTFNWVDFPELLQFDLWGIEIESEAFGNNFDLDELSAGYEVGDIVHLEFNNHYQKKVEYLGKRLSDNSVEYDLKITKQDYSSIEYETRSYEFGYLPSKCEFDEYGNFVSFKSIRVIDDLFQGNHKYRVTTTDDLEWVFYEGEYYWGAPWAASNGSGPWENCNVAHYYQNYCSGDGDCWDIVYVNNSFGEWGEPLEFEVEPYTMIRPDMQNIFAGEDFFGSETLIGTRIDTIEDVGYGVTRYYNYKTAEKYLYDEEREYVDPKGSWTGMYHEVDLEGVTTFFNEYYEPIVFYPQAAVGFTWSVFSSDDYEYEGEITGINYQEILPGLMDSVKLISISSKKGADKGSRYQFRLSKNYGLLDIPFLYGGYFHYTRNIKSIKTEEAFYGQDYEIDQIFNGLEVSHELHYSFSDDDHWYQIKRELIAKNKYPYKVEYIYKRYQHVHQSYPSDTSYYELFYDTIEYPQNLMPKELVLDQSIFGREFYMGVRANTSEHCGEELRRFDIFPYHRRSYLEIDGRSLFSMREHNGLSDQYNNDFVDHLGHYRAFQHDTDLDYDHIKYIKSPNLTCGEPYWFDDEDYQVILPEFKSFYQNASLIRGIRVDSIESHTGFVRYYSYPDQQEYEYSEGEYLFDPNGSWMGMYVDVFENGDNVFYDQDYIPITIKTKANIGDSWLAYSPPYGDISATILSKEYLQILPELYDSVKWIRISYNNLQADLRLSKNYGMLDMMPFYRFYVHSGSYQLVGFINENEQVGDIFPLDEIINSLNIGDEMYYRNTEFPHSFFKRKLIDKQVSEHRVDYIYEYCGQINELYPNDTTYYQTWSDTVSFPLDIMPNEIIFDTSVFGKEYFMSISKKIWDNYCIDLEGFRFSCHVKNNEIIWNERKFWGTLSYDHFSEYIDHVFVCGIGNYVDEPIDSDADFDIVDYYVNGELSCGEPYEISCDNTGFEELMNSKVSIFPNPSTGIFNLSSSEKIEELKVYHFNGQIVWQADKLEGDMIDLSELENGIYLMGLQTKNQNIIYQKVIINK